MWKIILLPEAIKDLNVLDKDATSQITKKLEVLEQTTSPRLEKLEGFDYYKLRAGDYRIIVVLDNKTQTIEVRKIGHRKKIYKGLK